ncbi:hypothetical protein HanRHA438_Chr05g0214001 [Helianthus annuus]|nr:hypothetical protein HanRHA438_Chr05g0214001 [Helianthus annuus]
MKILEEAETVFSLYVEQRWWRCYGYGGDYRLSTMIFQALRNPENGLCANLCLYSGCSHGIQCEFIPSSSFLRTICYIGI